MLQPFLKRLADSGIPHALFVNKIDKATGNIRDLLASLQEVSEKPLVLRQIPIWENGIVTGFVDLALERAYVYREGGASELIELKGETADSEKEARFQMMEKLADHDEHLMEELLSDVAPPRDEIFDDLQKDLAEGIDRAGAVWARPAADHGIARVLKFLRHEAPDVTATAERLGLDAGGDTVAHVLKTYHTAHGGKLSLVRVLAGHLKDGAVMYRSGRRRCAHRRHVRAEGAGTDQAGRSRPGRHGGAWPHGRGDDGRNAVVGQGRRRSSTRHTEILAPVYGLAIARARPQGRSEAHRRDSQVAWRKTPRSCSNRTPSCTRWRCWGRAKSI